MYLYQNMIFGRSNKSKVSADKPLWHQRLWYPSLNALSFLPFISGVNSVPDKFGNCDVCFKSKQTHEVFYDSFSKASNCFNLIHCDIWGLHRVPSCCGANYFLTFVDDYFRTVRIFLLLEKSEVKTVFLKVIIMAQ